MAGIKDGYKGKRRETVPFNTMEMNQVLHSVELWLSLVA